MRAEGARQPPPLSPGAPGEAVGTGLGGQGGPDPAPRPQENVIREFNLNELYQKAKKQAKPRDEAAEEAAEGPAAAGLPNGESKKDK